MKKRVVFLFMILLLTGCSMVSKEVDSIVEMAKNEQFSDVNQRIEEMANDESFSEDQLKKIEDGVAKDLSPILDQLVEQFKEDEIDVDDFLLQLEGYRSINFTKVKEMIDEVQEEVNELIESRESFANGLQSYEKGNIERALDDFLQVDERDKKYDSAQEYISKLKENLWNDIEEMSSSEKNNEQVQTVYTYLKNREKYFLDDPNFQTLFDEFEELLIKNRVDQANEYREKKKYDDALEELSSLKIHINRNEEVEELISNIEKEKEDYLLNVRKDELLEKMDIHYDSMNDVTCITRKGNDCFEFSIPKNRFIFQPSIQVLSENIEDGVPVLMVLTGFSQDDWVFTEQIRFNADGKRFSWELDFGEMKTEVDWGYIYEWVIKNSIYEANLEKNLEIISKAESVEIRFDGDTKYRDETLSVEQKEQIRDILELYEILNSY